MRVFIIILLASISIFSGFLCTTNGPETDCICTQIFVSSPVYILDQNKNPIDSLNVKVKRIATGQNLFVDQQGYYFKGMYFVLNDLYTNILTTKPEKFLFTAENNKHLINQEYQFNTDECKCHINKVSGPDTIIVNTK